MRSGGALAQGEFQGVTLDYIGLDGEDGLVELTGDQVPTTSRSDLAPGAWTAAVAAGRRPDPA